VGEVAYKVNTTEKIFLPEAKHTKELGILLSKQPRMIIALTGPLGAGKTTLVQGIAEGLGVIEKVNSPTFNLINEYHSGQKSLYHVDLYRFLPEASKQHNSNNNEDKELLKEELEEIFTLISSLEGIVAIEWAGLLENYLPPDHLQINLTYVKDDTARCAELSATNKIPQDIKQIWNHKND
jgi:tRNA threonylcarbamoyladenosine biosynthesis protein TsaE